MRFGTVGLRASQLIPLLLVFSWHHLQPQFFDGPNRGLRPTEYVGVLELLGIGVKPPSDFRSELAYQDLFDRHQVGPHGHRTLGDHNVQVVLPDCVSSSHHVGQIRDGTPGCAFRILVGIGNREYGYRDDTAWALNDFSDLLGVERPDPA